MSNKHKLGQIGTRGKELNKKINQFISKNTWEQIPLQYRKAILDGVKQGQYSGSHFADGTPKPIKSEWLTNLHPAVLKYKGVRSFLSRGLGIDPGLIDKGAIVKGLVSNIKPNNLGIRQTITPGPPKPLSIRGKSPFASNKVVDITASSPVTPKASITQTPPPDVMASRFMKIGRDKVGSTPGAQGATLKIGRKEAPSILNAKQTKEAKKHYDENKLIREHGGRKIASTSVHHMGALVQNAEAIDLHPKGNEILEHPAYKNIPKGDDIGNYTAISDWNTSSLRSDKVAQAHELYPNVPRKTIDDALGASDFKPTELTKNEFEQLKLLKSRDPSWTMDRFLKEVKKDTGRPFGSGSYPSVDLFNKDGSKTKYKFKTGEEWDQRWDIINKHYGSNIEPKKIYSLKVDPELATYAPDHGHLHKEILDKLPSHIKLEKLKKSGEWEKLSVSDGAKLLRKVNIDAIQASNKISKWRYSKIAEYYSKFSQNSSIPNKYKMMKWDSLPTDIQRQYFKENASKLSSYRSRDVPKFNNLQSYSQTLTKKERAFWGVKSTASDLKIKK